MTYGCIKDFLVPDYDLLQEGKILLNKLKERVLVQISWVKGHFNGEKAVQHELNDEAHSLAYDFLANDQGYYNPSTRVIDPTSSEISILFDNSTLTSKLSTFLREQLMTTQLQATICKSEE